MPNTALVRVEGLGELQSALKVLGSSIGPALREELRQVAEPVRSLAEAKASSNIRNLGVHWSQMRTGLTNNVLYIAPKARRHGGSPRPNLAGLLMDRAMQPALTELEPEVVAKVELLVERLNQRLGF